MSISSLAARPFLAVSVVMSALFTAFPAGAQSRPGDDLPDIQVTATRQSEPVTDTLPQVTLISAEDIRRSAAQDLPELLRLQPGVDTVRSGGPGGQTSVFLRGANSNHVLVLVDGVRVASANTGAFAWEQLPLTQVERVEIVRGPRASLYGSDAIGGVIQVFTRRGEGHALSLTAGSLGTAEISAGTGTEGETARFGLHAAYRSVDGISAQNPTGFAYDPDDDGYRNASLGLGGTADLDAMQLEGSLLAVDSEVEFDQGVSDFRQWIGSLALSGRPSERWEWQMRAGYADESLDSDFGFFSTGFSSERMEVSWLNYVGLGEGQGLVLGADARRETGRSDDSYDEQRDNLGVFGLWQVEHDAQQVQLSARWDDDSEFGGEWTGQADWGLRWDNGARLRLGAGRAFRAPNLNELFSPGFGGLFAGNPELQPETSDTVEAGLAVPLAGGTLELNAWHTDVDGLIAFSGPDFRAVNVDRARLRGADAAWRWLGTAWRVEASVTVQDAEDRTRGAPLLRRPDEKGTLVVERHFDGGAWLGLEFFASGPRPDFAGVLPGYGLMALRGGWPIGPATTLRLRVDNLAARDYEPAAGFNATGRTAFATLDWRLP